MTPPETAQVAGSQSGNFSAFLASFRLDAPDGAAALTALLTLARDACQAGAARLVLDAGPDCTTLCAVGTPGARDSVRAQALSVALDPAAGYADSADTRAEPRFAGCPEVSSGSVLACAGVPLRGPWGEPWGTLLVTDAQARPWAAPVRAALSGFATLAASLLQARREATVQAGQALRQAGVLASAVRGASLETVLEQLVTQAQAQAPGTMSCVMVLDPDGERLLWGAGPALPADYRSLLDGLAVSLDNGAGAAAAARRDTVISEDIGADALWLDLRELALDNGLRACWSMPVLSDDGVLLGTFDTYHARPRRPDAAEIERVRALAATAAVAIARERGLHQRDVARETMEKALTLARLGTWSYDPEFATLTVSEMTCEIMGLPLDSREISVYDYIGIVHPADRMRVWRECFNSLVDGQSLRLEYRMRRRDGSVCYVEGNSQPEFDGSGQLVRFSGVLQDLTGRRSTDHMLHVSYQAMQTSNNGVLLVDASHPDMPILDVNPAFEQLTGYMRAEVLGRNCRFLQRDDRDQVGLGEIRAALAQQRMGQATLRNYKKDGTVFWADLRIAPLRDESGQVSHYAGYLRDASERVHYAQSLAHQALHDPLTGLPNRHLLEERLAHAIKRAAQTGRQVGVVMIDLDRFKRINDSLGHLIGDELLKQIATRLGELARDEDTVARFGGDEFVFVAPGGPGGGLHDELRDLSARIAAAVALPTLIAGNLLEASASIGVTLYPLDGANTTDLIKNADAAMYHAKSLGRAQSHFFDLSLSADANTKFEIEAELVRALRDTELVLHYQPEFDARSGVLRGFEALIRWQHPQRGLLGPDTFIPIAEESGLIDKIGDWVMVQACRQLSEWRARGMPAVPMAVNVSRVQFRRVGFVDRVMEILAACALPPALLCLEVTETMVMEDAEPLRVALEALRAHGVRVAIDDFGTGYSSLGLIKQLPIDVLKIDRTFVRDLSTDPSDAAICRTIISMAQNLGLEVLAEGVETEAQIRFLQQYGCNILQGYALCRPGPAEQIEAFVRTQWRAERVSLLGVQLARSAMS